ncbi:MAG: PorV/PorQ family protein, partial [bacterium]
LEDEISSSSAVDVGILFKQDNLSLGACVSNLGTRIKFIKEKEELPLNLKLGLGYKLLDNRVILALDINRPVDNDINFGVGTEYQATNNLFVRAGYNSKNDVGNGISLGCGFRVKNFYLDYGFLPYEQMGDVHRFSLQFKLSEPVESKILSKESKQTIPEKTTSLPEQEVEKKVSELPKETIKTIETIKKPSKEITQWIKGERYKVTEGSVSGGNRVWLRIGTPKSRQTYSLEKGTQIEYLGEEKKGFYRVVVTSEGVYKGRQGWIWGGSFEKAED